MGVLFVTHSAPMLLIYTQPSRSSRAQCMSAFLWFLRGFLTSEVEEGRVTEMGLCKIRKL